jgi:hypothetical protein
VPRTAVAALLVAGASCSPAVSEESALRTISALMLDSLPERSPSDGARVCVADGANHCPLASAYANWIGSGAFALWEPSRVVQFYAGGDSVPSNIGARGDGRGQYSFVLAVGPVGLELGVIEGPRRVLLRFDRDGTFRSETPISTPDLTLAPGYSGAVPVIQRLESDAVGAPARLRLHLLDQPTAAEGRLALDEPVPWLRLKDGAQDGPTPFFSVFPAYAVAGDRSVVWSPADSFMVQRRSRTGDVVWTLVSDRQGPAVLADELVRRREAVQKAAPQSLPVPQAVLDTMVALAPKRHAPIGGILLEAGERGSILLAGATTSSAQTVEYLILSGGGVPQSRFRLPATARPLLFAGDSVLVHRSTETEFREVRWLLLDPGQKAGSK